MADQTAHEPTLDPSPSLPATPWTSPERDAPMRWLRRGWVDFNNARGVSIISGAGFFLVSWMVIGLFLAVDMSSMILPAIAGGVLAGPLIAAGLYEIARQSDAGEAPTLGAAWIGLLARTRSQLSIIGVVLMTLLLSWLRAATIIFALFFGLIPLGGLMETTAMLFETGKGLSMILVGTLVGGIFAAFTFAISVFSVPMLIDRNVDAFTAMGRSFSAVTHNVPVMIRWGAIVAILSALGVVTGLLAMIVIFPVLGFATWRAYQDMFSRQDA